MADSILQIKEYNDSIISRTPFVSAMIQMFHNPRYEHNEFMDKLSKQPTSLVECVNVTQYKELIEEIYNWKRKNKVNLRF
jgi:hypothetical protein